MPLCKDRSRQHTCASCKYWHVLYLSLSVGCLCLCIQFSILLSFLRVVSSGDFSSLTESPSGLSEKNYSFVQTFNMMTISCKIYLVDWCCILQNSWLQVIFFLRDGPKWYATDRPSMF
jgi:hypothetical protein